MSEYNILRGKEVVPVDDVLDWAEWFEIAKRTVAKTNVPDGGLVSTVFLGCDHSFGCGPPSLFETMVFGGPHSEYQERCGTWEEAEAMHRRIVEMCAGPNVAAGI